MLVDFNLSNFVNFNFSKFINFLVESPTCSSYSLKSLPLVIDKFSAMHDLHYYMIQIPPYRTDLHADRCHRPVHLNNNFFDVAGEPIHECICLVNRERYICLQNKQETTQQIGVNSALVAVLAADSRWYL